LPLFLFEEYGEMQMEKAHQLRKIWGDKPPCKNPIFAKEYIQGSDTGDLVCTNCGHYECDHTPKGPTSKKQEGNLI
jgi:hypothetical protein